LTNNCAFLSHQGVMKQGPTGNELKWGEWRRLMPAGSLVMARCFRKKAHILMLSYLPLHF
jgi:hypothetical protein